MAVEISIAFFFVKNYIKLKPYSIFVHFLNNPLRKSSIECHRMFLVRNTKAKPVELLLQIKVDYKEKNDGN